jgi:hypothetical protein
VLGFGIRWNDENPWRLGKYSHCWRLTLNSFSQFRGDLIWRPSSLAGVRVWETKREFGRIPRARIRKLMPDEQENL